MRFGKLYECDVCLKSESVCLLPLVGHERILAVKLIKSTKPRILLMRNTLEACDLCFKKLHIVKLHLLRTLNKPTLCINKMHYKPPSPAKEETTENLEAQGFEPAYYFPMETSNSTIHGQESFQGQDASFCTNDYNCKCDSCQNKYGSLPVLLQGIEQKYETDKTESQPSTSSQKTTGKTMSCEYCKKNFTHKGDFNKHLRKHTREKPFSCTVCERKFAHTSNLLRHQRLHSGHKPFICEHCDRSFSRKDKLDCHKRSRMCQGTSSSGSFR